MRDVRFTEAGLCTSHRSSELLPGRGTPDRNGITLCSECHREPHRFFKRRPEATLPMDAEGAEQIEAMVRFLVILLDDAKTRGLLNERYYTLRQRC